MPQLTIEEQRFINTEVRVKKRSGMDVTITLNELRARRGEACVDKSTVYRFMRGETHDIGRVEARGRKPALSPADITHLDHTRRRLIKQVAGNYTVTYGMIFRAAGMTKCSARVAQDAMRALNVRFRPPRAKVQISAVDAKKRLDVANTWAKIPPRFWRTKVAYVDNKAFPMPLTPSQRERYRQTLVTGHLRTPDEGVEQGFTKPRQKHSWIGLPSVTITGAVAKDRIILWHVLGGNWNGQTAADMYTGPLRRSLVRAFGNKRKYIIVEDGDRKGNQSNKGIAAKSRVGIEAMTLPPRTPSLMPLDYAIWAAINKKMVAGAPHGTEAKAAFLARLARTAKGLSRTYIKKVIARYKANITALIAAKGYHPKND